MKYKYKIRNFEANNLSGLEALLNTASDESGRIIDIKVAWKGGYYDRVLCEDVEPYVVATAVFELEASKVRKK